MCLEVRLVSRQGLKAACVWLLGELWVSPCPAALPTEHIPPACADRECSVEMALAAAALLNRAGAGWNLIPAAKG